MDPPSLMQRASQKCRRGLRRTFSSGKTRPADHDRDHDHDHDHSGSGSGNGSGNGGDNGGDKPGVSGRWRASWSSFSTAFLPAKRASKEDKPTAVQDVNVIPERVPAVAYFPFSQLPHEIRHQIYRDYWVVSGVSRHAFLHHGKLVHSPCITDHAAPDERQAGVARAFAASGSKAEVQPHPLWAKRMASKWCNHWRCEELWQDIQDGKDFDAHKTLSYRSLLLSCRWIYAECHPTLKEHQSITVTDGQALHRLLYSPRASYLGQAAALNISLREDSGNYLYLNASNIWVALLDDDFDPAARFYLWLDAECPLTRRLLTEFRKILSNVPDALAPRLTVDFPCDARDGFWAWGEVEVDAWDGCARRGWRRTEPPLEPRFRVVARGRQRFNETAGGYVSSADMGRPRRRVLKDSNPFEDILLYGRGFLDKNYV
ncbi:hypothetical protein CTA2_12046 [Colletotrichum tanaceti]|uniref:DUF7730 domain-containing protein n=1 Tax=Colletotrichum tanaceti TaxID=1306861 RepID=A0A4U6X236_9PEZI|nr:hypothetical protein CTA2_12046 [Colletotrichum tanaceti]TKW49205.1 hypothetical protein CTA1_13314 [Colletotrichum tanaceti]